MRIKGEHHKSRRIYRYDAPYRLIVLSPHHFENRRVMAKMPCAKLPATVRIFLVNTSKICFRSTIEILISISLVRPINVLFWGTHYFHHFRREPRRPMVARVVQTLI